MARFRLTTTGPKRPKYSNTKVKTPDGVFDSKREYKRWGELQILRQAGAITGLMRQVKFCFDMVMKPHSDSPGWLIHSADFRRKVSYTADFVYLEQGKIVVEDCKGFRTEAYKRKRQWMKKVYGITILET